MAHLPIFHGVVSADGRLLLAEQEQHIRRNYLARLAGKDVDVVVKVHRNARSLEQNAWHWGIAMPIIADALGYDRDEHDELHYWLVKECFGTHLDARVNEHVPNVRSSKLTTAQFSEFMEWEVRWAAKQGIVVPLPNESAAA
jgi:hypothetical protein